MRQPQNQVPPVSEGAQCAASFLRQASGVLCALLICLWPAAGSHGATSEQNAAAGDGAVVPFTVGERQSQLFFYPCSDCHDFMDPNKEVRELEVAKGHPAELTHGGGRMWCFSCHDTDNYGQLSSLLGKPIGFDQGYQVCSGCHSDKYRDWTHGGHGKRVANWSGERRIYSCVECHNPHAPAIAPRAPQPPPKIRAGLEPMPREVTEEARTANRPVWEQTDGQ